MYIYAEFEPRLIIREEHACSIPFSSDSGIDVYIYIFLTYLTSIRNPKLRQLFTKLRISDHNLMIEIGRRTRPITPVLERKCTLCSLNSIEDEVHFLIVCPFYSQPRSQLFSFLNCRYSTFKFLSSHEKFIYVLGSRDPAIINQTSQYISKATQLRLAYLSPPI